ncbi:MAG: glycosyl transferase [Clostridia bacterium]|nr:glycosyl transferase [Clostridia bacterium]
MLKKVLKLIENPNKLFVHLAYKGYFSTMDDEKYLKKMYKGIMGKKLDLENPKTFNEKLQWLKLHDRNPEYTKLVDKYAVREYIASTIGEEYLIPLLGVWDSADDIDFDALPNQFVLKCNHNSGLGMCICKDKSTLDIEKTRNELRKGLAQDYYLTNREWPYKNVKRKIIAEKYMVDESGVELKDYKIFCFNGHAEYVEVDFNRHIEHQLNPYDFDWNPLNFCDTSKNNYSANITKPTKLKDMRIIAEKLSKAATFMRVDFYSINDDIYVGELTLFPGAGFIQFEPRSVDLKYGQLLDLHKEQQ